MPSARSQALSRQQAEIDQNIARIEQDRPRNQSALAALASRLNVSQNQLTDTLRSTVFKGANDQEFAALVIVANEYGLNPLTKEIYAFPAKGGGIVPLVSVDGWIRIMNEHPQFDGIEFEDIIDDKGSLMAIEAVIYRKDRNKPIKVTEYLDECRRQTDPWKQMPNRMLRHKALIQGARLAFGFSGITSDDDLEFTIIPGGDLTPMPSAARLAQDPPHDRETGEILDQSPRDEPRQVEEVEDEVARELLARFRGASTVIDLKEAHSDWQSRLHMFGDGDNDRLDAAHLEAEDRLGVK